MPNKNLETKCSAELLETLLQAATSSNPRAKVHSILSQHRDQPYYADLLIKARVIVAAQRLYEPKYRQQY